MEPTVRHTARAMIVNPDNQILLIKIDLPWVPGGAWTLPGGGIEDGETAEACVTREVFEETGLKNAIVERELWHSDFQYQFRRKQRRAIERNFLVRHDKFEPTTAHMIAYELEWMLGFKWWHADEIGASKDTFSPKQIASLLSMITNDSFPSEPLEINDPLPDNYQPA